MRNILLILGLVACGGGDEAPSCQEAVSSFYAAGCVIVDLQTGQPFTEGDVILSCKQSLAAAPDQCQDELADLRSCFAGVANAQQCTTCADEQDAILTCE